MGIEKSFAIVEQMDHLIRIKKTGNPTAFAQKLEIGRSTLFEYLDIMRALGARISYDKYRQTYYYENNGMFDFHFQEIK